MELTTRRRRKWIALLVAPMPMALLWLAIDLLISGVSWILVVFVAIGYLLAWIPLNTACMFLYWFLAIRDRSATPAQ